MEIKVFDFGSDAYQESLLLRDRVLRMPLGMSIFNDNLDGDQKGVHIGMFKDDLIVGCLVLNAVDKSTLKMRQVAVDEFEQGKGIGALMVAFSEKFAHDNSFCRIVLNARKVVVGFYEKLGYQSVGAEFTEVGIPHLKMEKELTASFFE